MDGETLLPCPFCGSAPTTGDFIETSDETGERESYTLVGCLACRGADAGVLCLVRADSLAAAVTAWNHRAPPAPAGDAVERALKAFFKDYDTAVAETVGGYMGTPLAELRADMSAALAAANLGPHGWPPKGWKLVPEEPTREMVSAGDEAQTETHGPDTGFQVAMSSCVPWTAMLAAAPLPPTAQPAEDPCGK